MENDERWTLLASVMPEGIEVLPEKDEALIKDNFGNEITVIYNDADNSNIINGTTVHFDKINNEFVNTILVPYILQELDGERRI